MNIFILDDNLKKSAQYHVDKHCVKMILEQCQLLCSALILNKTLKKLFNIKTVPYQLTHKNHPCTRWVSKNYKNFAWLAAFTDCLHQEYRHRYGQHKTHLSYQKLCNNFIITEKLIKLGKQQNILLLSPVLAMPDDCKIKNNIIESYRNYYRNYKYKLFTWTQREKPDWL